MSSALIATLPDAWKWSPLKFVTTVLSRGTTPDYVDTGPVHVVSQAANQSFGLDWTRTRFHNYEGDPKRLKGYLLRGDVIINSTGTGTLGRVGYFMNGPDERPCIADAHITIARADRQFIEPRFLYYWLHSRPFYDYIYSALIVGATNQIELNRERLAAAPVALPSLEEQLRIVDFLDAETARIDLMTDCSYEQSRLLEERFLEIIRISTTGAFGPQRATGVDWMPSTHAEWTLRKVSREFRTSSGTTPNSEDEKFFDGAYPWVNSSDLLDADIEKVERSVTQDALDAYSALRIQPAGSLVIAMYGQGETKGRTGILRIRACLNQACCALIQTGQISTEFAQYWFRAHRTGVISLAYGAGQPNLSQELIRQLVLPDPGAAQQAQIVRELRERELDLRRQLTSLTARRSLLSERRRSLITAAVSGQIDVTTARGASV